MENSRAKISTVKVAVLSATAIMVLVLSGCESVPMPDMSGLDLGSFSTEKKVTIKQRYETVNVRPTPSTNQSPVSALKGGDQVVLKSEYGNWLNIVFYDTAGNEQVGWVYKYLVEGYEKPLTGTPAATTGEQESHSETAPVEKDTAKDDISIL